MLIADQAAGAPELWRLENGKFRKLDLPARSAVTGLEYLHGHGLEIRDPAAGRSWTV